MDAGEIVENAPPEGVFHTAPRATGRAFLSKILG